MIRHISRSARWRRALIAACLPYLLVSVFVDFVHVHARTPTSVAAAAGGTTITVPADRAARQPDYTCTACLWLRTGLQLVSSIPTRVASEAGARDVIRPLATVWPDSPISAPGFLRGPPASLLA